MYPRGFGEKETLIYEWKNINLIIVHFIIHCCIAYYKIFVFIRKLQLPTKVFINHEFRYSGLWGCAVQDQFNVQILSYPLLIWPACNPTYCFARNDQCMWKPVSAFHLAQKYARTACKPNAFTSFYFLKMLAHDSSKLPISWRNPKGWS